MTESTAWEPWSELLARRRREHAPWLVLPTAAHRTGEHRVVSYAELYRNAVRIAEGLRAHGVEPGDRVVLLADNGLESALTIFGALLAGAVLVPAAPPGMQRSFDAWGRGIAGICEQCDARALVGHAGLVSAVPVRTTLALAFDDVFSGAREPLGSRGAEWSPEAPALIQYTSGTTSGPRGATLTHANLRHNVWNIGLAFDARPGEVGVCWVPLFHDMGLIGCLLFASVWGLTAVLMTPMDYLAHPEAWLRAISRFGAVCSAAPNSAYHRCATRLSDSKISGLDLSRWRVAFNGSELIHGLTVERFCKRFEPYGFRPSAMYPVYGLAENTVAATLPPHGRVLVADDVDATALETRSRAVRASAGDGMTRSVVSVGRPLLGQELRVACPERSVALEDRDVGEIQLRGPCTMQGYWAQPEETARAFTRDGWLRTGDRGYLADGELYVLGRYKHVIKRLGRTLDGAFIENAVKASGFRGGVAAFGVADPDRGTERLVILAEAAAEALEGRDALERDIVGAVVDALSLAPDVVTFVPPGSIPRTTSGKIRHGDARVAYLSHGA